MKQSILMTRAEVSEYFGVSVRTIIRMEEQNKLKAIKLTDSEKGTVYYKRTQVEALVGEKPE